MASRKNLPPALDWSRHLQHVLTWASRGSRWHPRKVNTAGTSSTPSFAGVAGAVGCAFEVGPLGRVSPGALARLGLALGRRLRDDRRPGGRLRPADRSRYRGRVPLWHVVHRPASGEILGLTEEEQIRITARAIQVAHQADPSAQLTIGIDRPWAEWMGSSHFQLGPLHLCDYLLRAELGLSGIAIEIAPGYSAPGSYMRDLFEFSKLLDLYSLLNVPLHVWMAIPSADGPDPAADPQVTIESAQWPVPIDESPSGRLGGEVARPGRRQAIRPQPELAAGQRCRTPPLPARRPASPRPDRQAAIGMAAHAAQGNSRVTAGAAKRSPQRAPPIAPGELPGQRGAVGGDSISTGTSVREEALDAPSYL